MMKVEITKKRSKADEERLKKYQEKVVRKLRKGEKKNEPS